MHVFYRTRLNVIKTRSLFFCFCFIFFSLNLSVLTHEFSIGSIHINHPYIRFAVDSGPAAGYMTIVNTGSTTDQLIRVETSFADKAELHQTLIIDNQARMKKVDYINLPSEKARSMKPGGYHLMFLELKDKLVKGSKISVTLFFKETESINIIFEVEDFYDSSENNSH